MAGLVAPCLADRTWGCLKREGISVGVALALSEGSKALIHRTRPDGSDEKSFWSEHTALTCAAVSGTKFWGLCPAVGLGRIIADKHWASDVLTGGGIGFAVSGSITWVW